MYVAELVAVVDAGPLSRVTTGFTEILDGTVFCPVVGCIGGTSGGFGASIVATALKSGSMLLMNCIIGIIAIDTSLRNMSCIGGFAIPMSGGP